MASFHVNKRRYERVCYRCLQSKPHNADLLTSKCNSPEQHEGCLQVRAWWWAERGHLEVFYEEFPFGVPPVRPVPNAIERGKRYVLCEWNSQCNRAKCSYAHSIEERDTWNHDGPRTFQGEGFMSDSWQSQRNPHPRQQTPRNIFEEPLQQRQLERPRRQPNMAGGVRTQVKRNLSPVGLQDPENIASKQLTSETYQQKFDALVELEMKAHDQNLKERCDGKDYTLSLETQGRPQWLHKSLQQHEQYGFIHGLNSDQIFYATQASEREGGVKITLPSLGIECIGADILSENYNHVDDKLYIAFDRKVSQEQLKLLKCEAKFKLKYSYFMRLHDSVKRLSHSDIARLMPTAKDFGQVVRVDESALHEQLKFCGKNDDQCQALRAIVSTPRNGPPFLLTGAYGSGKTRILATASHYFFQQQNTNQQPVRILVCAQQHVSADAFLECFNELTSKKMEGLTIVRLIPEYADKKPEFSSYYKTVAQYPRTVQQNVLVVTTCSSALTLLKKGVHGKGYFTHILLDEGANMREPEAVAPFCFANEATKLVIAGDQHQIGPALLVEGEIPQKHGLAVSLLERLHSLYTVELKAASKAHHAMLVTNHRCHKEIVKLSELLFYDTPLGSSVDEASTHPDAPYPLLYVCSCLDDTHQAVEMKPADMEKEVNIALSQMKRFLLNWPADRWGKKKEFPQIVFASPTRAQLTLARDILKTSDNYPEKMKDISKLPTFNIQGHEFRALFLSTAEPTWKDGKTRNPTKSICDHFVFNTVLSRARSLVVCVGNPFVLLRMERHMQKKYGEKGKCWSNYLRMCIEHGTLIIDDSLGLDEQEKTESLQVLMLRINQRLGDDPVPQPTVVMKPTNESFDASFESKDVACAIEPAADELQLSPTAQQAPTRLETEYEVLGHLGKGGFGLVLHVMKKDEDVEYAMKIIKLPTDKKDREKVMREVKALAKISASASSVLLRRVVRYYTSWNDQLPPGWTGMDLWKGLKSTEQTYTPLHDQAPYALRRSDSSVESTSSDETSTIFTSAESAIDGDFDTENVTTVGETEVLSESQHAVNERPVCLFIQTELCKQKTLKDWLDENIKYRPRKTVLKYFTQILEAVDAIHETGLVHRDLKPSNIFFSTEDDSLKVGDFGLVVVNTDPGALANGTTGTHDSTANGVGLQAPSDYTVNVGTRLYMSPEQLEGKNYDNKVDIYALGLIFIELNYPFTTYQERVKVLTDIHANLPNFYAKHQPEATFLVNSPLLAREPGDRPTARQVLDGEPFQLLKAKIESLPDSDKMVPA